MYDLIEIVTRNFILKAPWRSPWKAAAAASVSLSPVRAGRRRRPCQSQVITGLVRQRIQSSRPVALHLGGRGRWPRGGGHWASFGATQAESCPASYSGIAALCSVRGWRSGSRSLWGGSRHQERAKLRRVHQNLIPQGPVKLDPPGLPCGPLWGVNLGRGGGGRHKHPLLQQDTPRLKET